MATSIIAASDVGQPPLIMSMTAAETSLRIGMDGYRSAGMPRLLQIGEEILSVTGVSSPTYTGVDLPFAVAAADTVIVLPDRHPFESLRYNSTAVPAGLGGTATAPTESGVSVTAVNLRTDGKWDATVTRTAGVAHAAGTRLFRTSPHDLLTVNRASNGTTARAHSVLEPIERLVVAEDFPPAFYWQVQPLYVDVLVNNSVYTTARVDPARWRAADPSGLRPASEVFVLNLVVSANQTISVRAKNDSVAKLALDIQRVADGGGAVLLPADWRYWYGETTLTTPGPAIGASPTFVASTWANVSTSPELPTSYQLLATDPLKVEVLQTGHYLVTLTFRAT